IPRGIGGGRPEFTRATAMKKVVISQASVFSEVGLIRCSRNSPPPFPNLERSVRSSCPTMIGLSTGPPVTRDERSSKRRLDAACGRSLRAATGQQLGILQTD